MRPDQSRSVDYGKEYSSEANNRITRMLTGGANGIARDEDLYPTYDSDTSISVTSGVVIKDDAIIHIGAERNGDNWNDFTTEDSIIDLTDGTNYIQSLTNPTENIFEMPGYWPTDSTASRAYLVLSYQYVAPEGMFFTASDDKEYTADGNTKGILSEQQDLAEGEYDTGQSPRYTPVKATEMGEQAEIKTYHPGAARVDENGEKILGDMTVVHTVNDGNGTEIQWERYHAPEPGPIATVRILKDPADFDPNVYVFLGMVYFKGEMSIVNPVMIYDPFQGGDPSDPTTYVTRNVFNFVDAYTDDKARAADTQNPITNHLAAPDNTHKMIATNPSTGDIEYIEYLTGSSVVEVETVWYGTAITIEHNYGQYVQVQILDITTKEEVNAEITQTQLSFTVDFSELQSSPYSIIVRY